jgi:hypothetical protein
MTASDQRAELKPSDLLPCPFCGCECILVGAPFVEDDEAYCDECGATADAVMWNSRALDAAQPAGVAVDSELLLLAADFETCIPSLPEPGQRNIAKAVARLRVIASQAVAGAVPHWFIARLEAYSDAEYVRGCHIAREDACLGWEHKAKTGKYGAAEHATHERLNRAMGAHFGIHEAIRTALASAPPPPAATNSIDSGSKSVGAPIVRNNRDGTLDEVVGDGPFHLEQMGPCHWWMQLGPHIVNLHSRGKIKANFGANDAGEGEARDAAPTTEHWRRAIQEMVVEVGLSGLYPEELEWIEQRASELARTDAAMRGGEGGE